MSRNSEYEIIDGMYCMGQWYSIRRPAPEGSGNDYIYYAGRGKDGAARWVAWNSTDVVIDLSKTEAERIVRELQGGEGNEKDRRQA